MLFIVFGIIAITALIIAGIALSKVDQLIITTPNITISGNITSLGLFLDGADNFSYPPSLCNYTIILPNIVLLSIPQFSNVNTSTMNPRLFNLIFDATNSPPFQPYPFYPQINGFGVTPAFNNTGDQTANAFLSVFPLQDQFFIIIYGWNNFQTEWPVNNTVTLSPVTVTFSAIINTG